MSSDVTSGLARSDRHRDDGVKVCVVGAGAVGGWLAARLALAGHRVSALVSRGPLDVLEIEEGNTLAKAVFERPDGPAELLIIAVKAPALHDALPAVRTMIGPDAIVIPMLNGVPWWFTAEPLDSVDPAGMLVAAVPEAQLIGSVVHASCSRPQDGRIRVAHADTLLLGEPGGCLTDRVHDLVALFEESGVRCRASDDIRRALWYKLWGNATINPLSALTRATCDRILADVECRAWMLAGMAELSEVGAAIGCAIAESGEDRMAVTARLGAFRTSMLQDVEAGRPIELEALLGAPREIARRHGIATPALDRLYRVTKLMADSLGL
jgi:2-dehydropantoate 2-reductase